MSDALPQESWKNLRSRTIYQTMASSTPASLSPEAATPATVAPTNASASSGSTANPGTSHGASSPDSAEPINGTINGVLPSPPNETTSPTATALDPAPQGAAQPVPAAPTATAASPTPGTPQVDNAALASDLQAHLQALESQRSKLHADLNTIESQRTQTLTTLQQVTSLIGNVTGQLTALQAASPMNGTQQPPAHQAPPQPGGSPAPTATANTMAPTPTTGQTTTPTETTPQHAPTTALVTNNPAATAPVPPGPTPISQPSTPSSVSIVRRKNSKKGLDLKVTWDGTSHREKIVHAQIGVSVCLFCTNSFQADIISCSPAANRKTWSGQIHLRRADKEDRYHNVSFIAYLDVRKALQPIADPPSPTPRSGSTRSSSPRSTSTPRHRRESDPLQAIQRSLETITRRIDNIESRTRRVSSTESRNRSKRYRRHHSPGSPRYGSEVDLCSDSEDDGEWQRVDSRGRNWTRRHVARSRSGRTSHRPVGRSY